MISSPNPNPILFLPPLLQVNLDKRAGISISCSHPVYCEDEKVVYNVGSTFLTDRKYHIMKIPIDTKKEGRKCDRF